MVTDILLFATLRVGLRHYYQPWVSGLVEISDSTYKTIQDEKDLEYRKMLICIAYEVGSAELIPLILRQEGKIPSSWQKIKNLYEKHFPKLLNKRG